LKSTRNLKKGDRVRYYISGTDAHVKGFDAAKEAQEWDANFPDENTAYYLKRLNELSKKFDIFFSEKDYREIFSSDILFEFDASKTTILTSKVEEKNDPDQSKGNYSIEFDV
jgi:DNA polymerase, archaea type